MRQLLAARADKDKATNDGLTPLAKALLDRNYPMMEQLLAAHAEILKSAYQAAAKRFYRLLLNEEI